MNCLNCDHTFKNITDAPCCFCDGEEDGTMSAIIKPQSKLLTDKHLGFLFRIMSAAGHIGSRPSPSQYRQRMRKIIAADRRAR